MTAVSLSDALYEKAEETASSMGIPQNTLFSMAVEEFIERHNGKLITDKINAVYEKIEQKEFAAYLNIGLEPVRNLTKDDSW